MSKNFVKKDYTIVDKKMNLQFQLSLTFKLDNLKIEMIKKGSDFQKNVIYKKEYSDITTESNIEKFIEEFYLEYLEKKSVELYFEDQLENDGVIEIELDDLLDIKEEEN